MAKVSDETKAAITRDVLNAVDQYTDEPVDLKTPYDKTDKMMLTKSLGIGPIMIAQLALPLTKISTKYHGRGVGVYDAQGAKSVQECIDLVVKSI